MTESPRPEEFFTPSGVRLLRRAERPGDLSWLFLSGGPGIGSESLEGLMDALDVPGTLWGVDLPGDGSNVSPPGCPDDPFSVWPCALLEAARAVPNPVFVGHSTGGMYLLSCPKLEPLLVGMALVSTAPDASWHPRFLAMTERHPLPEVDAAYARYEAERTPERLRDVAVASAEWNFAPSCVDVGRELLARMPYRPEAVDWSDAHFDHVYSARWWPSTLPTLVLSGSDDRIVDQSQWDSPVYAAENVQRRAVEGGAHFPWVEEPQWVRKAFGDLADRIA